MKKIILTIIFVISGYILNANWYQSDITYYKLVTNKTGISKVDLKELSAIGLDLTTQDTSGIRLLYCGKEIPYYWFNDELIYCIPKVDVLDEFTNDFVVFLYYDANNLVNKKTFPEAITTSDTLDYLKQHLQLRLDKKYFIGFNNLQYDYTRFKGWYQKILQDYPSNQATQLLENTTLIVNDLYLFPQKDSSITIKSYLATPVSKDMSDIFNAKSLLFLLFFDIIHVTHWLRTGYALVAHWLRTVIMEENLYDDPQRTGR